MKGLLVVQKAQLEDSCMRLQHDEEQLRQHLEQAHSRQHLEHAVSVAPRKSKEEKYVSKSTVHHGRRSRGSSVSSITGSYDGSDRMRSKAEQLQMRAQQVLF